MEPYVLQLPSAHQIRDQSGLTPALWCEFDIERADEIAGSGPAGHSLDSEQQLPQDGKRRIFVLHHAQPRGTRISLLQICGHFFALDWG